MDMKSAFLTLAVSSALTASADLTGLTDLTDDLDNRAAITGNDNLRSSNGANAFDIIGDVATTIVVGPDTTRNNLRFGSGGVSAQNPLWVTYQFKTPTIVNAYRIWNQSTFGLQRNERTPKTFEFSGSLDGLTWVLLDRHENESAWDVNKEKFREYEFDNPIAYTYYKMTFQAPIVANQYVIIQELEYFRREVADDNLIISGNPSDYGNPVPGYGTMDAVAGDTYELSIETPAVIKDGQVAGCLGWKSYVRNAADPTVWDLKAEGDGTAATFVHPGGDTKWIWQFAVSNLVSVLVRGEGTVSVPNDGWCVQGGSLTVSATPASGYKFVRWIGDTTGISDEMTPEISIPSDGPRQLTAFFVPEDANKVIYVAPDGNDENDGATLATAKATVEAAVNYLELVCMEGVAFVAPGIYEQTSAIWLTNAIEVVGLARPENVVLRNVPEKAANQVGDRVFVLQNRRALVSGLTIENGRCNYNAGGNVLVTGDGGTVSNCIIRSGSGNNVKGANVSLNSTNAVLTHCVISNGWLQSASGEGNGTAIFQQGGGGRISNCLITKNSTMDNAEMLKCPVKVEKERQKEVVVVSLNGKGMMDNCTIVDNCHTGLFAAVYAKSDVSGLSIYNCVMANNTDSLGNAVRGQYGNGQGKFRFCVSDDASSIYPAGNCKVGTTAEMFESASLGNYRPLRGGILENAGTANGLVLPTTDLKGNPRVHGAAVDVGCYELTSAGFLIRVR